MRPTTASMDRAAADHLPATITVALIAHTNVGKTTLARTLLGRDIGEVRDAPHVTEVAESHLLLESALGDRLQLWDTPGFGDSLRLVQRLRHADNPLGWLLKEVWDRHRDRPLWCSQQAVRTARDAADVVLYLVSAAEDPRDAGYLPAEMQVLRWIGKPVVALLNQVGEPRAAAEEGAEIERWRAHLAPFGIVSEVLALDAFARCWIQERVLLDSIGRLLPPLAEQLVQAARDAEPVDLPPATVVKMLLQAVGVGRDRNAAAYSAAMGRLAQRTDGAIRTATDRLIALHGLDGSAASVVLERLRDNYASSTHVDEGRAALWGSVLTGALAGLKADLAAGGLTFGAGMLVGGLVGGFTGAGVARGINRIGGGDRPLLRWSDDFLAGMVQSAVLRYLAVAHFGRGRGRYVEGEAPGWWQGEVKAAAAAEPGASKAALRTLWTAARAGDGADRAELAVRNVQQLLATLSGAVLERLYPGSAAWLAGESRAGAPVTDGSGGNQVVDGSAVNSVSGHPAAAPPG